MNGGLSDPIAGLWFFLATPRQIRGDSTPRWAENTLLAHMWTTGPPACSAMSDWDELIIEAFAILQGGPARSVRLGA